MESRVLGRTGLRVSALGFGCGNVGGLMVRGTPAERERAVGRALELGINYFDTAPIYGDGRSEEHLGLALRALGVAGRVGTSVHVGTKVRLPPGPVGEIPAAIERSLAASLRRLGLERVDLLQLHSRITAARGADSVSPAELRDVIVPTFARLVAEGRIGHYGITAIGDTPALHEAIADGAVATAQVVYNLLNPSAGHALPPGFPAQDFAHLLDHCAAWNTGVIAIRVAAAGALSGVAARHPVAVPSVDPIASGPDYAADVKHARMLHALVDEGHAESLIEASLRFALASPAVSTVLLGYSSLDHLEHAARSTEKGPLSAAALARLEQLWSDLAHA